MPPRARRPGVCEPRPERETETERESERDVCDKILIWTRYGRDMDGIWRLCPDCAASCAREFILINVASLRAEQREVHLVGAVVLAVKVEQRRACAAAAVAQRRAVAREEA